LKSNDLNIINLEAALTTSCYKVPKIFNFKADPDKVGALKGASIHVVNLANNHVLDYSEEGF
jgi:poly-gamma-glutamate synthesis protein (capsule biosynthesis protein)